nr:basic proline-rich protein-like isoform X1 [Caretta caretta]
MEALIRGALAPCPFGMRVKSLKKLLAGKYGAKLEAFSQARGYRDVVSFLGDVPGLTLRDPERGNNCIVQLQRGETEVLMLLKCLLRPYQSGLRLQKVQEVLLERHRLDLKRFVSSQGEEDVLGFLQRRLPTLQHRQAEKGENCIVWLGTGQKKGSGSLPPDSVRPLPGSKRCLLPTNAAVHPAPPATDCLNPRLPSATTNRPLLPSLPSGREPFRAPAVLGKLGKSPRANPRLPAWLLSPPRPTGAPLALRAEEGTQESGARPASAPLALRAEEGTQESRARPASAPLALRAEEGTQESRARPASAPLALRAEEGTQESGAQPPEDLRELKQKVGAILAGYPRGMSLFQFRAAYSAAHQHPLPLGRTASTKQRLAQMPDVVRMQGCGVQMLLLPVDPNGPPGGEPGLALWIPQEAAALAGDPDDPSDPRPAPAVSDPAGDSHVPAKPCSTLAKIPPAPTLTGDPNTPTEPPPLPAAPTLTGDPDTPAKPLPTLAEIPPVLTAPDRAGDPKVPVKPPPTFMDPRPGLSSQALQRPEAARPEASWELPNLVPSAPVVLPALGPGSSSWFKVGAESPPTPGDPGAAARPVVYPPPQEVPPAPTAGPEPPSLCPEALGPSQARLKRVQLVPPFQDHPWAGDAPRAQPVLKALGQNQGTSAAVGSPVGPIPADPSTGQAISPAKQLPVVAPDPLPPPDASVLATPEQGWPETGPGGDVGSPVDPLRRCSPTQLVPSAGRTRPGPWGEIPSAPLAHSPPRNTDTCIIL